MRGRSSLAIERLQSDYRSCPGKAGGSLFGSRSSDWPTSTLFFARELELYPKHFIKVGTCLVTAIRMILLFGAPSPSHRARVNICHVR